ncbi:Hypothetical protein A7982_08023 [Minicystis rosea]|nr:Hypothetical protein A7982_08023 [Minicystis rosea]
MTERSRLQKLGGGAFIAAGILFAATAALGLAAGPPPSNGTAILAWAASERTLLAIANELSFFAALSLVPAVPALYRRVVDTDEIKAMVGCGIIAATIPILLVLCIVHGRLVYPVFGLRIGTAPIAELVVTVLYGGAHAASILMGIATFVLSLGLMRLPGGKPAAYLGVVAAVMDVIGAYPDTIGPRLAFACQALSSSWFLVVGATVRREPVRPGSPARATSSDSA